MSKKKKPAAPKNAAHAPEAGQQPSGAVKLVLWTIERPREVVGSADGHQPDERGVVEVDGKRCFIGPAPELE
jgi:hypothetical protein